MRLGRPAAVALLALCVAVVLALALSQRWAGEEASPEGPAARTAQERPDGPTAADPADGPTQDDGSTQDAGADGPTGTDTRDWDDVDACRAADLPPELGEVADDVEAGGPFAYPGKDGSTFGNYEGYLPQEPRGYYREYTVETPGLDHRGARRIVTGGDGADPEVWYLTQDHYQTFCEFAP